MLAHVRFPVLKVLCASLLFALGSARAELPAPGGTPVTPPPGVTPVPGATPPPAGGAPAATPGAPRPYKEILKDSKVIPGLFKLHQKDEKVWIEIRPDQLDKPFYFTYNIPQSIGERGMYGSQMGGGALVVWKLIGKQVQLIEKNTEFYAKPGTPQAQFVSESFSDSLLASAATASLPHPETKAIIVEVNSLLFGDIPGYLTRLETAFRMPFALDARNTSIAHVNNNDAMTGVQVKAHFSVPKMAAPPLTPPPVPLPRPPSATPDPRSLFVSFYYTFTELPEQPMAARVADERVGHFTTSRVDFSDDISPKTRENIVNRWRLEKKDPAAAVSEPKQPIVYWVDKNVPTKYRESVTKGILEWNKAFEKAGFKNAIVVKQQTDKDEFDTMDGKHASVRWFTGADVGFAIGPSRVDPRSGEIVDADIGMSDVFGRGARRMVAEDIGRPASFDTNAMHIGDPLKAHKTFLTCNHMQEAAGEMHFAMDVLEARGMDMDAPEADAVAQAYVLDVMMHEVGHTLGLRHNFRGSTVYSLKQVQDPEFTRKHGITTSVMEYTPFNLATKGEKQGEYSQSTLGPYDYWAIEYAYKQLDPATEKADLAKIAGRQATEPTLAYATDEDAGYGNILTGIDPDVNRFDLGSDPIAYYKKRMQLSRELWDRIQTMQLKPGESYERLTRSFASGFSQVARIAPLAAKYVGGVAHYRDRAGSGRALYVPTPVARQREALNLVTNDFFKVDSFKFKPEFVSRIGIDHFARTSGAGVRNPDVSVANAVLNVQRAVLDQLMADDVAARLLTSQEKVADPSKVLKLADMYDTLQGAIWSELKSGQDISSMRRDLQREYLRRVAEAVSKPSPRQPADARALKREAAVQLQADIRKAVANSKLSKEARAHLNESQNTLNEALKATLNRTTV